MWKRHMKFMAKDIPRTEESREPMFCCICSSVYLLLFIHIPKSIFKCSVGKLHKHTLESNHQQSCSPCPLSHVRSSEPKVRTPVVRHMRSLNLTEILGLNSAIKKLKRNCEIQESLWDSDRLPVRLTLSMGPAMLIGWQAGIALILAHLA